MAANGQKLRVAVTKTSAQGKAAQSSTPNLMSFSTDENSIWFNNKRYIAWNIPNLDTLTASTTAENLAKVFGTPNTTTFNEYKDAYNRSVIVCTSLSDSFQRVVVNFQVDSTNNQMWFRFVGSGQLYWDINVSLEGGNTWKVKSVNKTQLPTGIANSLTDTSTTKALSAAQGKVLNDKITSLDASLSSNVILMSIDSLPDGTTTEDQTIYEALGTNGKELYNSIAAGATIVDIGGNNVYVSNIDANKIVLNSLYLLDDNVSYSKIIELTFADTGQYNKCVVQSFERPIVSVVNDLTSEDPYNALSAEMGKKLNDEKLAKTDVINSLSDSSTNKALSAAQGKVLNDRFNSNKININFSATQNSSDNTTIKGYMGNLDGSTLVSKLTYGANLVDSSSENWVITPQEVSATRVVFVGLKLQSFNIYAKTITVTISGVNYTNMTVVNANRYVPNVINNLTSSDTANALSAAQGKALNDKINGLGTVYNVKGTKSIIEEVFDISDSAKKGDVWNITGAFILDGKPYPAGTNVVCIQTWAEQSADPNKNWDALGGTVDLSPYAKKTEVEESDNEIWEQLGVMVAKDEIVNDLVTNNSSKPLSAAQGKKLQDEKLSKVDASNTYLTKTNAESTYAKKADIIPYYNIAELTALSSNPTQEQLKTALGTPSAFRNAIDAGKLILVAGHANVQSKKSATCIIDSGNVIVKYLYPGDNDWIVIAKCVPASAGDTWDNAQFSVRIVKPSDSAGITIE